MGRGAVQVAAEMMRLALAISTCTAPPMRNVSVEKHGARGEGNLLSFGDQCGGEWLRSLAPKSLVYLGVRKDGRSGPGRPRSQLGTEIQLTFISSPTNPP